MDKSEPSELRMPRSAVLTAFPEPAGPAEACQDGWLMAAAAVGGFVVFCFLLRHPKSLDGLCQGQLLGPARGRELLPPGGQGCRAQGPAAGAPAEPVLGSAFRTLPPCLSPPRSTRSAPRQLLLDRPRGTADCTCHHPALGEPCPFSVLTASVPRHPSPGSGSKSRTGPVARSLSHPAASLTAGPCSSPTRPGQAVGPPISPSPCSKPFPATRTVGKPPASLLPPTGGSAHSSHARLKAPAHPWQGATLQCAVWVRPPPRLPPAPSAPGPGSSLMLTRPRVTLLVALALTSLSSRMLFPQTAPHSPVSTTLRRSRFLQEASQNPLF